MERDYREVKRELEALHENTRELYKAIDIAGEKEQLASLEKETFKADFWSDLEESSRVNKRISQLKKKVEPWEAFMTELQDTVDLMEIALAEEDVIVLNEIGASIPRLRKQFDEIETLELLSGEDDERNAFVTVHAGAGGTESQDWAHMLLRMYTRWAEKNNFAIDMIDYMAGEEAGIKGATILVKGDYAFGYLKGEMGVHRLVRISPFDANKRRHTSFASVEVIPEVSEDIDIDIQDSDLRIDTFRASGAGGQHVNTTDSAVRITHLPTGVVVSCQNERSQHKNKSSAMKILKARIYELKKQERDSKFEEKAGEKKEISWGNQIRSYVFQPYTMVKDHRTEEETGSVEYVLDGDLDRFMYAYLKHASAK